MFEGWVMRLIEDIDPDPQRPSGVIVGYLNETTTVLRFPNEKYLRLIDAAMLEVVDDGE